MDPLATYAVRDVGAVLAPRRVANRDAKRIHGAHDSDEADADRPPFGWESCCSGRWRTRTARREARADAIDGVAPARRRCDEALDALQRGIHGGQMLYADARNGSPRSRSSDHDDEREPSEELPEHDRVKSDDRCR
jgi:hypothetical protein